MVEILRRKEDGSAFSDDERAILARPGREDAD